MERVKGIEPSYSAWKAAALPLSYTRITRKMVTPVCLTRQKEWWGKQDSNLRRRSQRIYSPPPLPLGTFPHTDQTPACKSDLTSAMSNIRSTWAYRPHPRCRRGPLYGGPWGGCQHEKAIWGEARAKSYWKSMPPHPVGSSCQAPCPGAQHQT